jgi:hypothetical protein
MRAVLFQAEVPWLSALTTLDTSFGNTRDNINAVLLTGRGANEGMGRSPSMMRSSSTKLPPMPDGVLSGIVAI